MNKFYCVYEEYTEDFTRLNGLVANCDLMRLFDDENEAMQFVKNELALQCDNDDEWEYAVAEEKEDKIVFEIYYMKEMQYRVIIKEMELN